MKTVQIRNITIGEGRPKICVPIIGQTEADILEEAKTFSTLPVDVVEWRVDWFDAVSDTNAVVATAAKLRVALGDTPLLFTFRTKNEGGEKSISLTAYQTLNLAVAASGSVDLVDVELFTGDDIV